MTYAYTPEGWLSSVTKADGAVLTYEYDKTGSLLTQNVGDGRTISSSYNELGMVTEVTSTEGTIVYQYNEQGYLISVTNVNGDVVSYVYDEYGNKTSMTYPDGRAVLYTYDGMNRMTSVTGLDGEVTTYAYDAAGRRIETASGTLTTKYRFDSVGNLLEQVTSGASEIAFTYSYNKNGFITGEVRTENGTTTENTYTYDALGQLTSFLQSTGYGESYAYDAAGNMTEKVVTGTDGAAVVLAMSYNAGNQLVSMANGGDAILYSYDANGSMVQKILTSEAYGTLTDAYTYDGLDQLTGYVGYDGYQQAFAYDANGMRLSKRERGETTRSTLEELLRGNIAGLPEVVQPTETVPEEYAWATTDYLYDITQEYYQVIQETTTSASGSTTTAYAYGLERIAAYSADSTTSYVYDERGSVVEVITAPIAGDAMTSALPDVTVQVRSFAYTAYGEQMGMQKVSGFAYNAEAYDAATGMINLRARQYEPAIYRFSQKDILRGTVDNSISQNRYIYCIDNPVNYCDFDGRREEIAHKDFSMAIAGVFSFTIAEYAQKSLSGLWTRIGQFFSGLFGPRPTIKASEVYQEQTLSSVTQTSPFVVSTVSELCEPVPGPAPQTTPGIQEMASSATAASGMPDPDDPDNNGNSKGRGDLQTVRGRQRANKLAKELGYKGAEELKKEFVKREGSHFNIVYSKTTGEIFLQYIHDSTILYETGLFMPFLP